MPLSDPICCGTTEYHHSNGMQDACEHFLCYKCALVGNGMWWMENYEMKRNKYQIKKKICRNCEATNN